jgi:hypothetical protein
MAAAEFVAEWWNLALDWYPPARKQHRHNVTAQAIRAGFFAENKDHSINLQLNEIHCLWLTFQAATPC